MDTLYYDGNCPLCAREVRTLKRLNDGGLAFEDIHALADSALPDGVEREDLLRRLHTRDHGGRWHLGLEATVLSWSHTPLGILFRPLLWPGFRNIAEKGYARWADRRYCRLYHCPLDRRG